MRIKICLWLTVMAALCVTGCSRQPHANSRDHADLGSPAERLGKVRRGVYRFSVVPGGVYSSEEIRRARSVDRVVAEHYAGIGQNAVAMPLPRAAAMYVSYRIQDKIYWTSQKRRIPKGEPVLSDGVNLVRRRCGNRLSSVPMTPTKLRDEPPDTELEERLPLGNLTFTMPSVPVPVPVRKFETPIDGGLSDGKLINISWLLPPPPNFVPPVVPPIEERNPPWGQRPPAPDNFGGVSVGTPVQKNALVSIPEAGTWLLSLVGLVLVSLVSARAARSTSSED